MELGTNEFDFFNLYIIMMDHSNDELMQNRFFLLYIMKYWNKYHIEYFLNYCPLNLLTKAMQKHKMLTLPNHNKNKINKDRLKKISALKIVKYRKTVKSIG